MTGRVALVTGASRGIGAATARLLARNGAAVGVNYHRSEGHAHEVIEAIRADGGAAVALQADVGNEQQVAAMYDELRAALGPADTLILNAVADTGFTPTPLLNQSVAETIEMTSAQLQMCLNPLRVAVPSMVEQAAGSIVAIGSEISRSPVAGMGSISVAKSGVAAAMHTLALELGPQGIRVNVVAPGLVLTELNDFLPKHDKEAMARSVALRRNATPDDVAGAVLLMASEHAGFVTGTYLPVHGGVGSG